MKPWQWFALALGAAGLAWYVLRSKGAATSSSSSVGVAAPAPAPPALPLLPANVYYFPAVNTPPTTTYPPLAALVPNAPPSSPIRSAAMPTAPAATPVPGLAFATTHNDRLPIHVVQVPWQVTAPAAPPAPAAPIPKFTIPIKPLH